ncbi:hypothetical protein FO440_07880 [Mucilaginibacter corticis]|uniref:DUF3575 domain-containing protein n=1 Tax=Mucilaginibacter corticis TaxID=2597670 RepID=A0A556MW39_9SPHI|nr:hypothetical protein [Mucilaginibacter corticis]TSJ44083.1 hypothetical protein FO440_07880 [Mucilaginibacter corticis]
MLSGLVTFAQVKTDSYPNQIIVTPLRIVDPINPGFELGYQRSYHNNFATLVAVARMSNALLPKSDFTDYKGWRLDLEQKYFLPTKRSSFRMYIAANMVYLKADYKANMVFAADTSASSPAYNDNVDIHKRFIAGNLKYGVQLLARRFVFDFYAGFGGELRKVTQSGLVDPNAILIEPRELNLNFEFNKPFNGPAPSITMNARIAYKF